MQSIKEKAFPLTEFGAILNPSFIYKAAKNKAGKILLTNKRLNLYTRTKEGQILQFRGTVVIKSAEVRVCQERIHEQIIQTKKEGKKIICLASMRK